VVPAAWEAVASGAAVVVVVVAAGAGGDHPRKTDDTKEHD
jgi:hypothetical protein